MHSCGLAHCDIKPENIMLMADGTVKLSDFGAAVAIDPTTGRVAAMPAEIASLEAQLSIAAANEDSDRTDADNDAGNMASMAAMTPYSLRKVTQARLCCTALVQVYWCHASTRDFFFAMRAEVYVHLNVTARVSTCVCQWCGAHACVPVLPKYESHVKFLSHVNIREVSYCS